MYLVWNRQLCFFKACKQKKVSIFGTRFAGSVPIFLLAFINRGIRWYMYSSGVADPHWPDPDPAIYLTADPAPGS